MKKNIIKIWNNRYFFLFILLFAYAQTIHARITVREHWYIYIFTPEAAISIFIEVCILFLIIRYFIQHWQRSAIFNSKEVIKIFGISIILYVLILQIIAFIIAVVFGNVERNFNWETSTLSSLTYLLDGFIYGSFYLAYSYYNKYKRHQNQLATFNLALSESRIKQLKTQLNPHFLFNNLNVLDQLIEEDKHKASDFLNEFAEIYRYVLQATDKKLIPIVEELGFAEQYFKLIQYKYGNAYQLILKIDQLNGFVVPLTLQLLIENAIQHNLGTSSKPIVIRIIIDQKIHVSNNLNIKQYAKLASGRALINLKEQYALLNNSPIEIKQSDETFSVFIPIVQVK